MSKGGRPGSEISNHAAQTIQLKYRYHRKAKSRKGSSSSQKPKNKRQDSKEKETSKDRTKNDQEKDKQKDKKKPSDNGKSPVKEQDLDKVDDARETGAEREGQEVQTEDVVNVSAAGAVLVSQTTEETDKAQESDKPKPLYVDRGTQVCGVSSGSPGREIVVKKDFRKRKTSNKKESKNSLHDNESSQGDRRLPEAETKSLEKEDTVLISAAAASDAIVAKTKNDQDEEPSCDDDDIRSERSSSHGNVSDVESSSSDVNRRQKFRKRSPAVRSRSKISYSKSSSHHSSEESEDKSLKALKRPISQSTNRKETSSYDSAGSSGRGQKGSAPQNHVSSRDAVNLTPRSNPSPRSRAGSHESTSDLKYQEKRSKEGSESDRGRGSQPSKDFDNSRKTSGDEEMGTLFSTQKTRPSNEVKSPKEKADEAEKKEREPVGMNGHLPERLVDNYSIKEYVK